MGRIPQSPGIAERHQLIQASSSPTAFITGNYVWNQGQSVSQQHICMGSGVGGNDDAGSELAELMHAFGVPVRTRDQEVLDIQSDYVFSEMRLYLLILEMVEY